MALVLWRVSRKCPGADYMEMTRACDHAYIASSVLRHRHSQRTESPASYRLYVTAVGLAVSVECLGIGVLCEKTRQF